VFVFGPEAGSPIDQWWYRDPLLEDAHRSVARCHVPEFSATLARWTGDPFRRDQSDGVPLAVCLPAWRGGPGVRGQSRRLLQLFIGIRIPNGVLAVAIMAPWR
jgi:hypothetical protein